MKPFVVLTLLLLVIDPNVLNAQELNYDLKTLGIHLGSSTLTKSVSGDIVTYQAVSEVNVNFLFTESIVTYTSKSVYNAEVLQKSQVEVVVNGSLKESVKTFRTPQGYEVIKYEDKKTKTWLLEIKNLKFSSSKLFFVRPSVGDTTLAEPYGNLSVVKKTKTENILDIYNFESKSKTIYTYKNQRPIERVVEYPLMNFKMFLREENP